MNNIKELKYTHPASMGYYINKIYLLDELKKELSLDKIKILFTPIGWTWNENKASNKNKLNK